MMSAEPESRPQLRCALEDFRVDEVPAYAPSGSGEHTFVRIEKRDATTEFAAKTLGRALGVSPAVIGIAGRKDRRAVTTQWLSLPGVDPDRALRFEHPNVRVLSAVPNESKLRTGHLRGNRFEIRLRGVSDATLAGAQAALAEVGRRGFPNRYGDQRFGREGDNADRARAWLRGERGARPRSKREGRFLLSALQAEVFNRVLDDRPLAIDEVEVGDVAFVHGSGGRFLVEDARAESERAARLEISATGPIFGTKMMTPAGRPAEREAAAFEALGLPMGGFGDEAPPVRARGTRRALRERAIDLEVQPEGAGVVRLACELRAGSYVTVLIETLFGSVESHSPTAAEHAPSTTGRGPGTGVLDSRTESEGPL